MIANIFQKKIQEICNLGEDLLKEEEDSKREKPTFQEDIYCLSILKFINSDVPQKHRELVMKSTLASMI